MRHLAAAVPTLFASLILAGCASLSNAPETPKPVAQTPAPDTTLESPPPNDSLNATVWFQTSVERDLVFREIYRAASERLDAALADKSWDALPEGERDNDPRSLPPAIIADIDETLLDNSPNQVRLIRDDREYNEASWGEWVEQRAAKPLPGAVDFLRAADDRGIAIFYVSNRDASLADATVDNLRQAGFPIDSADQFLGLGTIIKDCEQESSSKSCRRRSVGRGYRVLMQFGDQVGDFVNIVANTPEGRPAAVAPYADWFGQRWWVLPNPVYGAWEPALFDNSWRQPAAVRRAAKKAALDDARD